MVMVMNSCQCSSPGTTKFSVEEELKHVKHVEVKVHSRWCDVEVWKELSALSYSLENALKFVSGQDFNIHSVAKNICTLKKSSYNHETRQECSLASEKQVGRIDVSATTSVRSDMVVARCWQQWITEGRVYRRGGQDVPGTQMIARSCNQKSGHFGTNNVASIDSTPLTSFRHPVPSKNHKRRLTEVGRGRRPLRRLPLTPHHRQCRLDFCRPRATWSVTDWRRVIFSDESRFSLSADDHRTRVWSAPASGPIRHLLSSGIQQFHKV
ncbi:HTH_Tnp_Tc3_2 domain-containing protein [Trichonephila clavipes]|nr:HTH_Tnp_Tc3_2 domain-containing protein [Trichonephila clavipes]